MNRRQPRITLHIDSISSNQAGISREALSEALHGEISRLVATEGVGALGQNATFESLQTRATPSNAGLSAQIASATIRAVKR